MYFFIPIQESYTGPKCCQYYFTAEVSFACCKLWIFGQWFLSPVNKMMQPSFCNVHFAYLWLPWLRRSAFLRGVLSPRPDQLSSAVVILKSNRAFQSAPFWARDLELVHEFKRDMMLLTWQTPVYTQPFCVNPGTVLWLLSQVSTELGLLRDPLIMLIMFFCHFLKAA